jgi:pimeloyl-ACP methyl ester carboxylesterase
MYLQVNGSQTYCYTGGKPFDPAQPTAVFIHGVLNDHSVWILQSRFLAHHGWNVLAVDLPGHCRSGGQAPASVEAAADFIAALLDAAGVARAALIGHSWGSLIALEAAARLGERISHLVMVGTAYPMKVSAALLDASLNEPMKALKMINVFSRSTLAPPPSVLGPVTWVYGASMALGIVLNLSPIYPASDSPNDIAKAKLDDGLNARWYLDPLFKASYPGDVLAHLGSEAPVVLTGDLDTIAQPLDYLGVNYYTRNFASTGNPSAFSAWKPAYKASTRSLICVR